MRPNKLFWNKSFWNRSAVPNLFGTKTGLVEDNFSMDLEGGMVWGRFELITFIVHFISIIITSATPQSIRHLALEDGDP